MTDIKAVVAVVTGLIRFRDLDPHLARCAAAKVSGRPEAGA